VAFDTPPSSLEFPIALLEEGMNNYFPAGTIHSYNNWDNWVIPFPSLGQRGTVIVNSLSQEQNSMIPTVAKYERQFDLNSKKGNLSKIHSKIKSIKKLMIYSPTTPDPSEH